MIGFEFENKVTEILKSIFEIVYVEKEIRKKTGISKLDQVVVLPSGIIAFQCKYTKKNIVFKDDLNCILGEAEKFAEFNKTKLLKLILVTRVPIIKNFPEIIVNITNLDFLKSYLPNLKNDPVLYDHQKNAIKAIKNTGFIGKGRICCFPTGTGKTIIILGACVEFIKMFPQKRILWITKRLDVLRSQFNTTKNIKFFPQIFQKIGFYASNYKNNKNEQIIITNVDSFTFGNFGLILVDECHLLGARVIYEKIKGLKTFILGFSATPFRENKEEQNRITDLFEKNYLTHLSFYDAIEKNLIVKPRIDYICADDDEILLKNIVKTANKTQTGRVIIWCGSEEKLNVWFELLAPRFNNFILLRHYKNFTGLSEFEKEDKDKKIIFCIGKLIEGYDYARVDTGITIDIKTMNFSVLIQKMGRLLRHYPTKKFGRYFQGFYLSSGEKIKRERVIEEFTKYIFNFEKEFGQSRELKGLIQNNNYVLLNDLVKFSIYLPEKITWEDIKNHISISYESIYTEVQRKKIKTKKEYFAAGFPDPCIFKKWIGWKDLLYTTEYYSLGDIKNLLRTRKNKFTNIIYLIDSFRPHDKIPPKEMIKEIYGNIKI